MMESQQRAHTNKYKALKVSQEMRTRNEARERERERVS